MSPARRAHSDGHRVRRHPGGCGAPPAVNARQSMGPQRCRLRMAGRGYVPGMLLALALIASPVALAQPRGAGDRPAGDATAAKPAASKATPTKGPRKGAFTIQQFESARMTKELKELQRKRQELRKRAIERMLRLLQQNPHYERKADIYFQLAESYREQEHYRFLRAMEKYMDQLEAYDEGRLKTKPVEPVENYDKALEYYRRILREFPDYQRRAEVLYYVGRDALQQGKQRKDRRLVQEAVGYFKELIQSYPDSPLVPDAYLQLAEHFFDENNLYYAKTYYEQIIHNYPNSPMYNYALYKLGWVYYNLTEFRKAINTFKRVVQIVGKGRTKGMIEFRDQALKDLVVCFAEVEDGWKEAREYFLPMLGEEETYKKLKQMAEIYLGEDKDQEAVELYNHFIEHDPTDPEIPDYFDRIITVYTTKLNDFASYEATVNRMLKFFDHRNRWYEANKGNAEAIKAADKLVENHLLEVATHYHKLAQKLEEKRHRREQAVEAYKKAAAYYATFLDRFPNSKHAYVVNFYYAEILYDPIHDYNKAIEQYRQVVERDKKGEYVEDALLGIIYSYNELMIAKGIVKRATGRKPKVVKLTPEQMRKRHAPIPRTELHELEKGYVQAADRYVQLLLENLKDPEFRKKYPHRGERIPEIMFLAAQVFYRHGQFAEAIKRLKRIFAYDPKHEMAAYAVNVMLDAYVRLHYWREVEEWASKLIEAKNFLLKSKRELNRIRAIAKAEIARKLVLERKYDKAVAENMSVYKEFRHSSPELASKALYNVAAIYERAKRFPEAIKTYWKVVKEFPKEEIAPEALFTIALIYESQTQFEKAAQTFEAMAKRFPKHKNTPDAILNAALIREAYGDYDGAIATYKLYIRKFKKRADVPKVELHIGYVYEDAGDVKHLTKAAKHYERFARKYRRKDGYADMVIEALSRAGQVLKRIDAAEGKAKHRRQATKLLKAALAAFAKLEHPEKSPARVYAAQAQFELAEYIYNDFTNAKIDTRTPGRLRRSIEGKAKLHQAAEKAYQAVLDYKSPQVNAGALFRIGKLYYDFAQMLFDVPVPEDLPPEAQDEYIAILQETAQPLEEKALTAFQYALKLALQKGVYNKWSKLSAEYAAKVNPDEFPVAHEPAVQPDHKQDTLLSTNFIRSLRRGNVEVEVIKLKASGLRGSKKNDEGRR